MTRFLKRYHPPGTPPGTLVAHERATPVPAHTSMIDYDEHNWHEIVDIVPNECKSYLDKPTVTWIHVQGHVEPELMQQFGELLNLHALVMEDVLNGGQLPKTESYDEQLFVIMSLPVLLDRTVSIEQLSVVAAENYVISFYAGAQDPFEPLRKRLRNGHGRIRQRGAGYLLYALLDLAIDHGFPVLEKLGEQIEVLEDIILRIADKNSLNALHHVKRELLVLRRMLWPQREVINGLMISEHKLIADTTKHYLRDCYDHTIQIMELIETYREMVASMHDIYLSSVSNRINETMRVLTVIATLFIPPTFLASIYGMNFDRNVSRWNMPELGWPFGYLLLWLVMIVMIVLMLAYFRRKKWF
jgi:magnesium transporter